MMIRLNDRHPDHITARPLQISGSGDLHLHEGYAGTWYEEDEGRKLKAIHNYVYVSGRLLDYIVVPRSAQPEESASR